MRKKHTSSKQFDYILYIKSLTIDNKLALFITKVASNYRHFYFIVNFNNLQFYTLRQNMMVFFANLVCYIKMRSIRVVKIYENSFFRGTLCSRLPKYL